MGDGNLDGFDVQLFGEIDGPADGFAAFAGETKDKISVHHQAKLVAILGELAGTLDGGALLDILQNLLVAGFIAHDQQTATGFLHGFQSFVVGSDTRGAGPRQVQRLDLGAKFNGTSLLNVEGIVVEEEFPHPRPVFFRFGHFAPQHRR